MNPTVTQNKELKLFGLFTGLFVTVLILSNLLSSAKLIQLGWFIAPAGVIVFPISFIFGDILTEVYGYTRSRKIIWTGFLCILIYVFFILLTQALPFPAFWQDQAAFERIFALAPRLAIGSFIAYLAGEFCNSFVMSKMKYWANGQRGLKQAWRFVLSTVVGEGVDTLIVVIVAFAGVLPAKQLLMLGLSVYAFKVAYEIIATPFTVWFTNWVKRFEGEDKIDRPEEVNYNPFAGIFPRK